MRAVLAIAVVLASAEVSADDAVSVGAAIGAGAQGGATFGAVDLRLDAAWPGIKLGLGARGVWDDGVFRREEWGRPVDAVTIVRDFEAEREVGGVRLALALGRLAPAHIGHVADGYRATLDDRWRTGARTAATSRDVEIGAEIDDVLDPALIGVAARWQMAPPWAIHAAVASDPAAPARDATRPLTVIELGADHRWQGSGTRGDAGGSIVAELGLGMSAVAFGGGAIDRGGVRWTARADVRAGTGTVGSVFGPLYRIERLAHDGNGSLWDRARDGQLGGASLGTTFGAATAAGWLELGLRARPGLGGLVVASGGAPMGRWLQAGLWAAAARADAAGAAELRVAWDKRLFSALQVARIYRFDAMDPLAVWSVTAWFGAASE